MILSEMLRKGDKITFRYMHQSELEKAVKEQREPTSVMRSGIVDTILPTAVLTISGHVYRSYAYRGMSNVIVK